MRIVVLGGGFAGMEAVRVLERGLRRRPDVEIQLVSDRNYLLFTPLLPQVASSMVEPRHIIQPVRDIRGARGFRFRRDTVRSIDFSLYPGGIHAGIQTLNGITPFSSSTVTRWRVTRRGRSCAGFGFGAASSAGSAGGSNSIDSNRESWIRAPSAATARNDRRKRFDASTANS